MRMLSPEMNAWTVGMSPRHLLGQPVLNFAKHQESSHIPDPLRLPWGSALAMQTAYYHLLFPEKSYPQ